MSAGSFVTTALCLLLMLAAAVDIWKLRIPNLFPIAIILLFPLWIYDVGWTPTLWQNAVILLVTFFGGALLFSRGWLGGGDVKLLAAIALWFDFRGAAALFLFVAIGGALLSILFILLRRIVPARLTSEGNIPSLKARGPIPYGVAIAGGALLAILNGQISPQPVPWYQQPSRIGATTGQSDSAASIMISWARDWMPRIA
ncbi:A24 family peptidase [Sphingomonas sp. UNC305MFCol5.2]|uniref:A24 family peptidase n=1 Tax=Sphingomonas sp. UNC305MFCol5.2 TaxID=1449076 RepID=UPI00046FB223|nr:prepilin peptidase [Sphingomonas sp. UNC305MFCol5.2]